MTTAKLTDQNDREKEIMKAGFDHPCRQTCSGWQQGYDRGGLDLELANQERDRLTGLWIEEKNNNNLLNKKLSKLREQLAIALDAIDKIEDPRKRDHREPDKYTEVGCMMNIATEAKEKIAKIEGKGL